MKRVKQISVDIIVDDAVDGMSLADEVADMLEERQFVVVGCGFQEDMTELYEELYPNLFERYCHD